LCEISGPTCINEPNPPVGPPFGPESFMILLSQVYGTKDSLQATEEQVLAEDSDGLATVDWSAYFEEAGFADSYYERQCNAVMTGRRYEEERAAEIREMSRSFVL